MVEVSHRVKYVMNIGCSVVNYFKNIAFILRHDSVNKDDAFSFARIPNIFNPPEISRDDSKSLMVRK